MFGAEDTQRLSQLPNVIINKILPAYDVTPALCLMDQVQRQQLTGSDKRWDSMIRMEYENLVEVRFKRWIDSGNLKSTFDCQL